MPDVRTQADVDVEEEYDDGPVMARWRPLVALALSLIGFGISMYLTIDHFRGIAPLCSSKGFVDCLRVTTSKYSYIFGVPVSLLGLIFYAGMVGINWPPLWQSRARWVAWARLGMAVGGVVFVLYLLAAELFSIKAICLWCTGVHAVTFLLFVLVVWSFPLMSGRALQYEDWDEDSDDA
jgi:uncharacterized membrane protein